MRPSEREPSAACRAEPAPAPSRGLAPAGTGRPRWDSARLFGAADEIEIVHGDAVYRMRITALGKLILTK